MDNGSGYNYSSYNGVGGGSMVDETGQPLKNRFGMKLAFSILEMFSLLLCGVISFILGLVGCVYTCKANTAYKEGDAQTFVSARKNSAVCLWIGGILSILRVVFLVVAAVLLMRAMADLPTLLTNPDVLDKLVANGIVSEADAENLWVLKDFGITDLDSLKDLGISSMDDLKNLEEIGDLDELLANLDGISIDVNKFDSYFLIDDKIKKVPITVNYFLGRSFELVDPGKRELAAGESITCRFFAADHPEDVIGGLVIKNVSDKAVDIEKAQVVEISLSREGVAEQGHSFMNTAGIGFGSTKEDVTAFYGQPEHTEEKADGSVAYRWKMKNGDGNNYIEIIFLENSIRKIEIVCE